MRKQFLIKMLLTCIFPLVYFSCEKNPSKSSANVPEVTTAEVSAITVTSAQCGGTIISDGGATITACGVCWSSTDPMPTGNHGKTTDDTGVSSYISSITGLYSNATYYVRAYATNSVGTSYGDTISFTTPIEEGTVTDIDGNTYQTVKIGNQWWMAENLKVINYRNGNAIPNITDRGEWINLTTGAYCIYGNDINNSATYGMLYNWYSVKDSREIAPTGWHIPTRQEWETLIYSYLDGEVGGKMKETGTLHWNSPNTGATNESGFSALPGGVRQGGYALDSYNMGSAAYFWSTTGSGNAYGIRIDYDSPFVSLFSEGDPNLGFSVRCVRD